MVDPPVQLTMTIDEPIWLTATCVDGVVVMDGPVVYILTEDGDKLRTEEGEPIRL